MGWQRLESQLRERTRRGLVGFVPYLTVGYPDLASTAALVRMLEDAGADAVELGVPFSDPLADGPTIQRASFHALKQGVTFNRCLETAASVRAAGAKVPLVFMSYYNPLLAHGLEATAKDAAQAGVDGFIVPDLPTEEAGPFLAACEAQRLALVPLLAPTSAPHRIAAACAHAHGFVYCVSITGVTGARDSVSSDVSALVAEVRRHTALPVAVGFGVSRRDHVSAIGAFADAVVVGSALIDAIGRAPSGQALPLARHFVAELVNVPKSVARSAH